MLRRVYLPFATLALVIVLAPTSARAQGLCTWCDQEEGCVVGEKDGWYKCTNLANPGECTLEMPGCKGGPAFASLRLDGTIRSPGVPFESLQGTERDAVESLVTRRTQAGRTFFLACGTLAIARVYEPEAISQIRALTKEITL